jgi:hypothetical protein
VRRTLLKRLEKLEKHPRCQPPPPASVADLLFQEKTLELLGQMDQRYAESVRQDLRRGPPDSYSWLTLVFFGRVLDHLQDGTPLAFPAGVAEAYVLNPDVYGNDVCRECEYKLPRGCFTLCPVCERGSVCSDLIRSVEKNALAEKNALITSK